MAEQEKSLEEIDHESCTHDIQLPTIHTILFFFASLQLKLSKIQRTIQTICHSFYILYRIPLLARNKSTTNK